MTLAHLRSLDLNLLVHLEALLAERHVTRAARRVGLTQPAMSRSLAKLREALDDPLLARGREGLALTRRGRELLPAVSRVLQDVEGLLARPHFEPLTAQRTFTLGANDYAQALLLPPLVARLSREAPGLDLAIVHVGQDAAAALQDDGVDLVIGLKQGGTAGVVWHKLLHDDFALIARAGHQEVGRTLGLEAYLRLSHVMVAPGGRPGSLVDDALAALGKRRRVAVRVPSFLAVPPLVASSDLVAIYPERLAREAARVFGVRRTRPPLRLVGFDLHLAWHEKHRRDAGHAWLRAQVQNVLA